MPNITTNHAITYTNHAITYTNTEVFWFFGALYAFYHNLVFRNSFVIEISIKCYIVI